MEPAKSKEPIADANNPTIRLHAHEPTNQVTNMKTPLLTVGLFLLFALSANAQLSESVTNPGDSILNGLEHSVLDYEDNLDISASKTIITSKEIIERGYDNLDELLSSVQGIHLTHDRNTTQIGIRGASPGEWNNQRVLILIDDIPLNNPMSGQAPSGYELRGIPMENIESVTIISSPMAVVYGNNAMLAVIKIKTKKAMNGMGAFFDSGSFGKLDGGLSIGKSWDNTSVSLSTRLGSVLGQDLYIPEYNFEYPHGDQMDYAGLQLNVNHRNFSFNASYYQREGAIALAFDPVLAPDEISYALYEGGFYSETNLFANISYEGSIKENQSVYARLFLNLDEDLRQLEYVWGLGEIFEKTRLQENVWTGVDYQHLFDFKPGHQLLLGAEFRHIPVANFFATEVIIPDTDVGFTYSTFGVFAHDSYQFDNGLSINGGIRADLNSRTDPVFAPQMALLYQPGPKTTFRAGYSRGYRLPSLLESDIDQEANPFPNPDLIPEISNSVELAWKQQIEEEFDLDVVVYYQRLDSLIINHLFKDFRSDNAGTVEGFGIEGGLSINLTEGIQTYLNYNFQFDNKATVNMPSPLCKFGVTVPFLKHFTVFAEGQYEGSRFTLDGIYTLPFFLMNSNLRFNPKIDATRKTAKWLNRTSISLRVYNLLDEFYQHPSRQELVTQFMGQNGRTWQTKLAVQF